MSLTEQSVREVVSAILEPEIGKTLGELGMVHGVELDGAAVALKIVLMTPAYLPKEMLEEHVVKAVQRLGASKVEVAWDYAMTTRVIQPDDPCPEVSNIVLVMSGKGGVGKSTVARTSRWRSLAAGASVGLLDADMYGPSVPTMFGVMGRPVSADGKKFLPLERFGVKLMSSASCSRTREERGRVARPDDPGRAAAVPEGRRLGPAGLPGPRSPARHRRHRAHDLAEGADDRRGHRDDAARGRAAGRLQVRLHGAEGRHPDPRRGRERELLRVRRLHEAARALRLRRRRQDRGFRRRPPCSGRSRWIPGVREWGDAGTPVVQAAPNSSVAKAFTDVAAALAGKISVHNLSREGALRIDRSGGVNRHLPIMR
jgi:ATP-binding protein involved in chromosome partitioning